MSFAFGSTFLEDKLITASYQNYPLLVKVLLCLGVDPNASVNGRTPLMVAAGAGHLEVVVALLILEKEAEDIEKLE